MRLSAHTWPFPFGAGLGWLCGAANPDPARARARVYLLRGQGVVFSRGLGALCRTLRAGGFWAEDLSSAGEGWAFRDIQRSLSQGRPTQPLVFVGHSRGGRASLRAAGALHGLGIPVDLLVCIDVAFPPPVPANVRLALNITRSRWRIYPAGLLRPARDSAANVENIDLDSENSPIRESGLHHLNITDSPAVQALVLERIRQAARP